MKFPEEKSSFAFELPQKEIFLTITGIADPVLVTGIQFMTFSMNLILLISYKMLFSFRKKKCVLPFLTFIAFYVSLHQM